MPDKRIKKINEKREALRDSIFNTALKYLAPSDPDAIAMATEDANLTPIKRFGAALFQAERNPVAGPLAESIPNQAQPYENRNKRFKMLQGFCTSLQMIGIHYHGKNPERLRIIDQIKSLAANTPKSNSEQNLIDLAVKIRNLLAEVTKDHRKGFFAYLFGTKCRLEKLILNCFDPLVKSKFLKLTKDGVEVAEQKPSPSFRV